MLGPSFSPSIARMPGPTSSHSRRQRLRCTRASWTRERSWDRATSSSVRGGRARPGETAVSVVAIDVFLPDSRLTHGWRRVDSHVHGARQLATDGVLASVEQHEQRAAEGLAVTYREAAARRVTVAVQITGHFLFGV